MKCPNCHNELEPGGSPSDIPANTISKGLQYAGDTVLCIYCSAELVLVERTTWLNKIGTYLIFIPVIVMLFFPQLIGENRWWLLLLVVPSIAVTILAKKMPTYKVRKRTDSEGTDNANSRNATREPGGLQRNSSDSNIFPRNNRKYLYIRQILGFAVFFVVFTNGQFEYTSFGHWTMALVIGVVAAGYAVMIMRLLEFSEKRYSKKVLAWYRAFSKRPMNVATIAIITLMMIPAVVILFIPLYCFIQIMKLGSVLLNII